MLTEVEREIINELIISFKEIGLKFNLLTEKYIEYFQWCLNNDASPWKFENKSIDL